MTDFPIINKLGGRNAAFVKLGEAGDKRDTVGALRMWVSRGVIPGDAVVTLMEIAEAEDVSFASDDFRVA